jgi:hypothetical protein
MRYGIATVPSSLQAWVESHPEIEDDIAAVAAKNGLGLLLVRQRPWWGGGGRGDGSASARFTHCMFDTCLTLDPGCIHNLSIHNL